MKRLIPLLLVLLLAGCAEMPFGPERKPNTAAWDLRQEALNQLQSWSIKGRLAVQTKEEGWTATLHWSQKLEAYTMRFIAPLGRGTYQLQGDDQNVFLLTADNRLYQAADPESLLQENLGWSVPLQGFKYWVKGVPEPGIDVQKMLLDDQGRIIDMEQSGWTINISRYMDVEGAQLPEKLSIQNDRIKLKLVVADWKTTP